MRRTIIALAALLLAVQSYADFPACNGTNGPCKRTFTGLANLVDGTAITSGKLIATPYGTVPTGSTTGLLGARPYTYTITSGALTCSGGCTIVAPANYKFRLYVMEGSPAREKDAGSWDAGVVESASAITMQDLYDLASTPVTVAADPLYAGEDLADGGSGAAADDLVLKTDGAGGAGWEAETGDISGVTAGTGLSGGGSSGAVTVTLADTAVTPGAYTNTNLTVDQQGRITAAANGSGGAEADTLATVTARGASTATATTFTGTLTRGVPVTPDATASSVFAAQSATDTPVVVMGALGQSVPFQEWKDSTGAVIAEIKPAAPGTPSISGVADSGYGVYGQSTSSYGVFGASSTGTGFYGYSTSGVGVSGSSTNDVGVYATTSPATTNTVAEVMRVRRYTSGTAAAGIGGSIDYYVESSAGVAEQSARIAAVLTTATDGAEVSAVTVETRAAGGAIAERLRIAASAVTVAPSLVRGTPVTADATADAVFAASAATQTPVVVQGAAAASVPLQEWQTSAGAVVGSIGVTGATAITSAANTATLLTLTGTAAQSGPLLSLVDGLAGRYIKYYQSPSSTVYSYFDFNQFYRIGFNRGVQDGFFIGSNVISTGNNTWAAVGGTGGQSAVIKMNAYSSAGTPFAIYGDDSVTSFSLTNWFDLQGPATVFNEDSIDRDFRVESDTEANAFTVDGGSGDIGFAGGYAGGSGATISDAGVIQANGAITSDAGLSGTTLTLSNPTTVIYRLASTQVDVGSATVQALYTVPSGKTLVVTQLILRGASGTFDQATDPIWNIGCAAAANGVVTSATYTTPGSGSTYLSLALVAEVTACAATEALNFNVTQAATASTTATVDVFGYVF